MTIHMEKIRVWLPEYSHVSVLQKKKLGIYNTSKIQSLVTNCNVNTYTLIAISNFVFIAASMFLRKLKIIFNHIYFCISIVTCIIIDLTCASTWLSLVYFCSIFTLYPSSSHGICPDVCTLWWFHAGMKQIDIDKRAWFNRSDNQYNQ